MTIQQVDLIDELILAHIDRHFLKEHQDSKREDIFQADNRIDRIREELMENGYEHPTP